MIPFDPKDEKKYNLESNFQDAVMTFLRRLNGCKAYKASNTMNRGISDVIVCYKGRYVAIELKVGDNKPSALQLDFIAEVEEAGGTAGVAYTLRDVKDILNRSEQKKACFNE